MYPQRDFRSLINDDQGSAIRAISREPFSELLKYWRYTGKPDSVKGIYDKGIEEAIAKDRYTCQSLDLVSEYPEFYLPVARGLRHLWERFNFRLIFETPTEPYLSIDSKYRTDDPEFTGFSSGQKTHILIWLKYKMNIPLTIDGVEYQVGIFPSRRAEEVLHKIRWLDSVILIK